MSKILARSPFWINATETNLISASIELWIYQGTAVTDRPTAANYTIQSSVTDTPNNVYWDISDLVKDFIDTKYTGTSSDNGVVWVDYKITKVTTSTIYVGTIQTGYYAVYGYSYYEDGYNYYPVDGCLIDNNLIYNLNGSEVLIPLDYRRFSEVTFLSGATTLLNVLNSTPASNVESASIVSSLGAGLSNVTEVRVSSHNDVNITTNPNFTTDTGWVKESSDWTINSGASFLGSSDLDIDRLYQLKTVIGDSLAVSFDITNFTGTGTASMRYPFSVPITGNGTYTANGVATEENRIQFQAQANDLADPLGFTLDNVVVAKTVPSRIIKVEDIEECKYTPYKIIFRNKNGAKQDLWFFKSSRLSMEIERDEYKSNTISDYRNNIISSHGNRTFYTSAKETMTINSGFVPEEFNEIFRQLMLSEQVWIDYNNKILPINISNNTIDYKTSLNNKLINYTIDIEFSFNKINNIR
tara:strand:- start:4780 stop:6189 length:1410 start_codon:yes stop_codon:yes gene_type:complete